MALDWAGQWRRLELPERKETTLSHRLTAKGARVDGVRLPACEFELGGLLYRRWRSVWGGRG